MMMARIRLDDNLEVPEFLTEPELVGSDLECEDLPWLARRSNIPKQACRHKKKCSSTMQRFGKNVLHSAATLSKKSTAMSHKYDYAFVRMHCSNTKAKTVALTETVLTKKGRAQNRSRSRVVKEYFRKQPDVDLTVKPKDLSSMYYPDVEPPRSSLSSSGGGRSLNH
jgi:hypothetical protein